MVRIGRDEILQRARKAVGERGNRYGEPEDNFERIAELWRGWLRIRKGGELTGVDVSVMMILLKVGRLANDVGHLDTWIDICGYSSCGGELAARVKENGNE
jgi:hypothetical protein